MAVSVYVGNLDPSTTEEDLRAAFASAGCPVTKVSILRSTQNERPRGFAFVEVGSEEEASAAIQTMSGVVVAGRALEVHPARERTPATGSRSGFPGHSGDRPRRPGGRRKR